jgi:hypothetical protein
MMKAMELLIRAARQVIAKAKPASPGSSPAA